MKPEIIRCPTCHRKRTRSNQANARYWLLLHLIADKIRPEGVQYSAETWHIYFKQKFLGVIETRMPNGKTSLVQKTTTELDTGEFADYMMAVETWAQGRGVYMDEEAA